MFRGDSAGKGRDMASERDPWKGRIRYYARLECASDGCLMMDEHNAEAGYRPAERFVRDGWDKHGGLWYCPSCTKGANRG